MPALRGQGEEKHFEVLRRVRDALLRHQLHEERLEGASAGLREAGDGDDGGEGPEPDAEVEHPQPAGADGQRAERRGDRALEHREHVAT